MSGEPTTSGGSARRRALKVAAAALVTEVGFSHAEDIALETLTEMMQSYIKELGKTCKAYAELSGRTDVMASDVTMALIDLGSNIAEVQQHARRPNKMILMPPMMSMPLDTRRSLQVGQKRPHPSHIPDHLPHFPDPHTYIKTPTIKEPVSEYQLIREKAASQKRDVERALTRFIAKTGDTENLFPDDPYAYPLIACKPKALPYLDALLPKDQDLDSQDHDEQSQAAKTSDVAAAAKNSKEAPELKKEAEPAIVPAEGEGVKVSPEGETKDGDADGVIDNPYLREIKMPKAVKTKKSKY